MSVFTIADLHLSGAVEKPMDVFGSRWTGHENKILSCWNETVGAVYRNSRCNLSSGNGLCTRSIGMHSVERNRLETVDKRAVLKSRN